MSTSSSTKIIASAVSILAVSAFLLAGFILTRPAGSDYSRLAAGESSYERRHR